jgi:hypothetical protein
VSDPTEIDLLLEAERRGILPRAHVEMLAEARRRGLVPGGEQAKEPMWGAERAVRRGFDRLTMGVGSYPKDAATAALETLGGGEFKPAFERQRARTRQALGNSDGMNTADVVADTAGETGLAVATAPLFMGKKLVDAGKGGLQLAQEEFGRYLAPKGAEALAREGVPTLGPEMTRKAIAAESTRAGAAFGTAGGYGSTPDNASLPETLGHMTEGAFGGAVIGRAIPGVINQFGDRVVAPVRNMLMQRRQAVSARANEAAGDLSAAGVDEFTPALGGPMTRGTAQGLQGTLFGSSIRQAARRPVEQLEGNIQREVAGANQGRGLQETGEDTQAFLKRQLTEPSAEVGGMDRIQLHDISGVAPGPNYDPKPPRVARVEPREIGPISPEQHLAEVEAGVKPVAPKGVTDVEGRYKAPTVEDVELPPELLTKIQGAHKGVSDLQLRVQAEREALAAANKPHEDALGAAGIKDMQWKPFGNGEAFAVNTDKGVVYAGADGRVFWGAGKVTPEQQEAIAQAAKWLGEQPKHMANLEKRLAELSAAQHEREIVQREAAAYRSQQLPVLAGERRAAAMQQAQTEAADLAARETQIAREQAREAARPTAIQEAAKATEAARAAEAERARSATLLRQTEANAAFERDVERVKGRAGEPLRTGEQTRLHSYPTEFAAGYEAMSHNAPQVRRNPLGQRFPETLPPGQKMAPLPPQQHEMATLLDKFAQEAPIGALPGYKAGQLFSESGAIKPEVLKYLRPHLGHEVTDILQRLSELRAGPGRQLAPGFDKLFDFRKRIGKTIRELRDSGRSSYVGTPRSENDTMLSRLYDALDQDIQGFLRMAGPPGELAAKQFEQLTTLYKNYVGGLREPLAKIFTEKDPTKALSLLVKDTQGGNTKRLEAFYRVVDAKGERLPATAALVQHMIEGKGLEGFMTAYKAITPDARALMAKGDSAAFMASLDKFAKAAEHLAPFAKASRESSTIDLSKGLHPGNLLAGLTYFLGVPHMLASALGAEATARVLSSKWFAGWLKAAPVVKAPKGPEWQRHINQLRALATERLDLDRDTARSLFGLFVVNKAKAGPGTSLGTSRPPVEEGSGSEWTDDMPRTKELAEEGAFRKSPWLPVKPDLKGRDDNSFRPWVDERPGYDHPLDPGVRDKMRPQKTMFVGENAGNADKKALEQAKTAAAEGVDPAKVWSETGWFQDKDEKWRFELDDRDAAINPVGERLMQDMAKSKGAATKEILLGDLLQHPLLEKAYPDIMKTKVILTTSGHASLMGNLAHVKEQSDGEGKKSVVMTFGANLINNRQALSLLLHETSHVVETLAGFEYGDHIKAKDYSEDPEMDETRDEMDQARKEGRRRDAANHQRWIEDRAKANAYLRRMGEAQARNVEKRRPMSPQERRDMPPWKTLDEPLSTLTRDPR